MSPPPPAPAPAPEVPALAEVPAPAEAPVPAAAPAVPAPTKKRKADDTEYDRKYDSSVVICADCTTITGNKVDETACIQQPGGHYCIDEVACRARMVAPLPRRARK